MFASLGVEKNAKNAESGSRLLYSVICFYNIILKKLLLCNAVLR